MFVSFPLKYSTVSPWPIQHSNIFFHTPFFIKVRSSSEGTETTPCNLDDKSHRLEAKFRYGLFQWAFAMNGLSESSPNYICKKRLEQSRRTNECVKTQPVFRKFANAQKAHILQMNGLQNSLTKLCLQPSVEDKWDMNFHRDRSPNQTSSERLWRAAIL